MSIQLSTNPKLSHKYEESARNSLDKLVNEARTEDVRKRAKARLSEWLAEDDPK